MSASTTGRVAACLITLALAAAAAPAPSIAQTHVGPAQTHV
jgi:hypothetical protein